jgi:hypothetical protein
MTLAVYPRPPQSVLERAILATAYVVVDDIGDGIAAAVLWQPDTTAIAFLHRALRRHADEGQVLYEVMLATTGANGQGLHVWPLRDG